MEYVIAVFCPPWAMIRVRKPIEAALATLLLIGAYFTWSIGLGVIGTAIAMSWACRIVGDSASAEEVRAFKRQFYSSTVRR